MKPLSQQGLGPAPPGRKACAASIARRLTLLLAVAVVFVPIVLAYTGWVYSVLRGKVTQAYIREQSDSVY